MTASIFQFAISGILVGSLYSLVSLAIVLVYKATHVFNFATGSMIVFTSFLIWTMIGLGLPLWLAILVGIAFSYIFGLLLEWLVLRPLIGQPLIGSLMATLALTELLRGLIIMVFSAHEFHLGYHIFPPIVTKIGPVVISPALFGGFVLCTICLIALILFFRYSPKGLSMRATADGHYIAQSVGIRVSTVFSVTWGIAGVICAIAGLALMDRIGFSIVQTPSVVIFCFAAVLMGGLDSVPGAILGGIIVGLVSSLASGLISSQAGMLMPYIVLMVVILVRPEGIWGLKRIERI